MRSVSGELVKVRILCAKTEVAPLKAVSIPRLRLCAAVLGSKLLTSVVEALRTLNRVPVRTFAWSDSTIVLSWLNEAPRKWHTFVQNRVTEAQEVMPRSMWRHVGTLDNPADLGTRGVQPAMLKGEQRWWSGPAWLSEAEIAIPCQPEHLEPCEQERKKVPIVTFSAAVSEPAMEVHRHSHLLGFLGYGVLLPE